MSKLLECLSLNIKTLRKERGFKTQDDLAAAAEVSLAVIKSVEAENSLPELPNLEKIAAALRVPPTKLFQDSSLEPTPAEALKVITKIVQRQAASDTLLAIEPLAPKTMEEALGDLQKRMPAILSALGIEIKQKAGKG